MIDDGDAGSALLADLLMARLASPPLDRPVLVLRQPGVYVPPTLADRAIQVVLGHEVAAATLTSIPPTDGWRLTFPDGSAPVDLLADLTTTPLSADTDYHGRIIAGLTGDDRAASDLEVGGDGLDAWYEGAPLERTAGDEPPIGADLVPVLEPELALGDDATSADDWEALAHAALGDATPDQPAPQAAQHLVAAPEPGEPASDADDWEALAAAALDTNEPQPGPVDDSHAVAWEVDADGGDVLAQPELAIVASDGDDVGAIWSDTAASDLEPLAAFDVDLTVESADDRAVLPVLARPRLGRRRRRGFVMRPLPLPLAHPDALGDSAPELLADAALASGGWDSTAGAPLDSESASLEPIALGDVTLWDEPLPVAADAAEAEPVVAPVQDSGPMPAQMTWAAPQQDALGDAALIAAWQSGVSIAELVGRMCAADPATNRDAHRARLRALLAHAQPGAPAAPRLPIIAPAVSLPPIAPAPTPSLAAEADAAPPSVVVALDNDEAIWADWLADGPLEAMLKARCGYERGVAANRVRDRVYRVVIPRIVAELEAEELVARLCEGRKPLKAQTELYETLLRRIVRQSRPVTGALREAMHDRIVLVMRYVVNQAVEV